MPVKMRRGWKTSLRGEDWNPMGIAWLEAASIRASAKHREKMGIVRRMGRMVGILPADRGERGIDDTKGPLSPALSPSEAPTGRDFSPRGIVCWRAQPRAARPPERLPRTGDPACVA